MKIIDPHLHLFDLEQGDYNWLKADAPPYWSDKPLINKSFNEEDLKLSSPLSLAGFVHIEAGFDNQQPWQELSYLKQKCQLPFVAIASIDLTLNNVNFNQQLEKLIHYDAFCGVRHILDEQALTLLSCLQVQKNIARLNEVSQENFTSKNTAHFIFEVQLPLNDSLAVNALCGIINQNRNITFIINHAGFPAKNIASTAWNNWQASLSQLSLLENIAIKCSGWEMTDRQYSHHQDWLNYNLETCFTIFGEERMMLASNFPLCLFTHTNYQDYWQNIFKTEFMLNKNRQEKSALSYHNALRYYSVVL